MLGSNDFFFHYSTVSRKLVLTLLCLFIYLIFQSLLVPLEKKAHEGSVEVALRNQNDLLQCDLS